MIKRTNYLTEIKSALSRSRIKVPARTLLAQLV